MTFGYYDDVCWWDEVPSQLFKWWWLVIQAINTMHRKICQVFKGPNTHAILASEIAGRNSPCYRGRIGRRVIQSTLWAMCTQGEIDQLLCQRSPGVITCRV